MKLQEIVDEVVVTTGRPDRADLCMRAVRAAVTEVHGAANFPRDRVEELFELAEPLNRIKVNLPPRFKSFEVLGAVTAQGAPVALSTDNNQYTRVDPSSILHTHKTNTTDVYYVAGTALNIKSSVKVDNVYALYNRFPEVADTQLETWIMREHDALITGLALYKTYTSLGDNARARLHRADWEFSMLGFIQQNIVEGIN